MHSQKIHHTEEWIQTGKALQVNIVSPEKLMFSGQAKMLIATGEKGELGILPQHAPLLTTIKPGHIKLIKIDGDEEFYFISGGFLEVHSDVVTVLADTIIRAEDIDEKRALEAKALAEGILTTKLKPDHYTRIVADLTAALAQIRVFKRWRKLK